MTCPVLPGRVLPPQLWQMFQVPRLLTPKLPKAPEAAPDLISLLIVTGAWGKAMLVARQMVLNNPTSPEGAQQVCRVFKAADLNTVRANAFLQYLGGQGANPGGQVANPVKAFMQEHPATAANTPGNSPLAVAPTQPVAPVAQPPAAQPPATL